MHSVICFKASLANLWHVTEGQPWSKLCTRTPAAARSQARHKGRKVPQRRKENTASWKWSYIHFICRTSYVRTSCGTEAWLALPGQRAIGGTRLTSNRMESAKSCATKWQKNEFSKSGRYKNSSVLCHQIWEPRAVVFIKHNGGLLPEVPSMDGIASPLPCEQPESALSWTTAHSSARLLSTPAATSTIGSNKTPLFSAKPPLPQGRAKCLNRN